jgi:DNA replication and repair protein RecF
MTYEPKVAVAEWEEEAVYQACLAALQEGWSRDVRRRSTGVGPHRDELRFALTDDESEVEMRQFGSGGQVRTAALALRLVEGDAVREARGSDPILLLDDAFAELDEGRRERVMRLMDQGPFGQVIITAPKESDVSIQENSLLRWGIKDGRIYA